MERDVRSGERYSAASFLALPVFLFCLVFLFPVTYTIWLSFQNEGTGGLTTRNYLLLLSDSIFWRSVLNTAVYVVLNVALHFLIGLGLALMFRRNGIVERSFRVLSLIPWTVPAVVAAITWQWLYNPLTGPLNDLLYRTGLLRGGLILWLDNATLALPSIIVCGIWRGFPFVMLILLAGLQSIPNELYEAAQVDGASRWQLFRYVTLPGLRKVITIALVLDAIWEVRRFDLVQVMTQGGPGYASEVLATLIYKQYFRFFRFNYASAMAVITSGAILLLSLPYLRRLLRED